VDAVMALNETEVKAWWPTIFNRLFLSFLKTCP